jgi:hypothetical protein
VQVGALVVYMLDASRQREMSLFLVWLTLALANITNAFTSFGRHGPLVQHVAVVTATTGSSQSYIVCFYATNKKMQERTLCYKGRGDMGDRTSQFFV